MARMFIVDGHLDLGYNAVRGRDVLLPSSRQVGDEEGIPTVGLPDLRAGGVGLIFATIFCEPGTEGKGGYTTADDAAVVARKQLEWYRRQIAEGVMRFVGKRGEIPGPSSPSPGVPLGAARGGPGEGEEGPPVLAAMLLLEGADPIREPAELPWWIGNGLRAVGLAWKRTRYAGGTRAPGPLTPEGVVLAKALDAAGIIHDTSHLAEESFWQLLDLVGGPVMASHSNCRAIVPTDRQLSDPMISALAGRGGVVGINFYDKFLLCPDEHGRRRAELSDVVRHVRHICDLTGSAAHVGIGTDMDGGLGREQIPREITSSADLPRLADALSAGGYSDSDVLNIMGGNWIAFLRRALPA